MELIGALIARATVRERTMDTALSGSAWLPRYTLIPLLPALSLLSPLVHIHIDSNVKRIVRYRNDLHSAKREKTRTPHRAAAEERRHVRSSYTQGLRIGCGQDVLLQTDQDGVPDVC